MPPITRAAQVNEEDDDLDFVSDTKAEQTDQDVGREAENENNHAAAGKPNEAEEANRDADKNNTGQKRKSPPTDTSNSQPSNKAARQNADSSSDSPKKLLNFLLSPKALPYCFPEEELAAAKTSSKYKSYSLSSPASFTPFEHLVCAHLLSKPLSHNIGMRSIRTLLNDPFNFTTPEEITSAGEHRVWEALEEARTHHRQKTASYLYGTGQAYSDSETMFALAQEANDSGPAGVIEHIKSTVPGLATVGGEIFCRRVQCVDGWGDALWPYADSKALDSLGQMGIEVQDAEDLRDTIKCDVNLDQVKDMGLHERNLSSQRLVRDEETTYMQAVFVVLLERAIGCVLENKVDELKKAAAKA
ncbi:uncharacterized protein A1O9_09870 [Exophiala aquamarina CBS 119918]|uniref:Uncharacterized protein n=1 Tax=Exophiala aquamarina CBS 119918 TaxID=1182545 RepID=A0A072PES0_9EURO|nr:uncharacterized protein A1O9_09870 [Exophiala aquamarina CBS 119918]KEF54075.1 hypothetical protein A1O9_09870 [Exophiala aquamarina CBS 119918]